MASAEDAILARRRLTNRLIAAHDAERLRPFFAPDAKVIVGDGGLILGGGEVIAAFAGQFRDPTFKTYLREPESVAVGAGGARAAERGRWTATWTGATSGGIYLAVWRNVIGQWVIESELYVTLS
jgi:hypothetical protein